MAYANHTNLTNSFVAYKDLTYGNHILKISKHTKIKEEDCSNNGAMMPTIQNSP